MAWASFALVTLLTALVDAASLSDQSPPQPGWRYYALELTSAAFFIAIVGPVWRLSRRLRPPRLGWPAALAAHLALSLPFALLHALWLALSRTLVFALAGSTYRFPWTASHLLFEWRKDVITLLVLAGAGHVIDLLARAPTPAPAPPPFRLEVRDGTRTLFLSPAEISHAEAAGNYVELHTRAGAVLHRTTLSSLEAELAPHGFVRIHRSRLVRRDAVTAIATTPSGDFTVTLAGGASLQGSRRLRSNLGA